MEKRASISTKVKATVLAAMLFGGVLTAGAAPASAACNDAPGCPSYDPPDTGIFHWLPTAVDTSPTISGATISGLGR